MSIADNQHSPGGFDVIAHCRNCLSDYEWFCDKDGGVSDMKQYFLSGGGYFFFREGLGVSFVYSGPPFELCANFRKETKGPHLLV